MGAERKLRHESRWLGAAIYLLLLAGAFVFLFPLAWLVITSLKPVEQAMAMPPTWAPRAYTATVDGRRTEVTIDGRVDQPSAMVRLTAPGERGRRVLVAAQAYDAAARRARIAVFEEGVQRLEWVDAELLKTVGVGAMRVTERSSTKVRSRELAWDVVPEADIATSIVPRWENYPKALATMGGRDLEEVEGSTYARRSGAGQDTDVGFGTFLTNTVIVCLLGVVGSVMSNAVIAYGLAKVRWRGRAALFALTLATMMVPFPVLMVPLYGVFKTLGLIGSLYPLWLPSFFGSAFNIFLMRQFFMTIPDELGEAARIDGCSEWSIFWRIVLPLSKPVLAVVALFHFLHAWNDFLGPLLYLTRKHTFTLALALANYQSQNGGVQWPYLMAASTVLILPIVVLFFLTQKTFVSGIATTGLKG